MRSVYVSHDPIDNAICDDCVRVLRARGFDVWYDREARRPTDSLTPVTHQEMTGRSALIVFLSSTAVASPVVQAEVELFHTLARRDSSRLLLVVRVGACEPPPTLVGHPFVDALERPFDTVMNEVMSTLLDDVSAPHGTRPTGTPALEAASSFPQFLRHSDETPHAPSSRPTSSARLGKLATVGVLALAVIVSSLGAYALLNHYRSPTGQPATTSGSGGDVRTPTRTSSATHTPTTPPVVTHGGSFPGNYLMSISMGSPTDGWAVGLGGVMFHLQHGLWTRLQNPPTTVDLTGVYMESPREGWAVGGTRGSGGSPTILHYLNGQWTVEQVLPQSARPAVASQLARYADQPRDSIAGLTSPSSGQGDPFLLCVSMDTPTDGWAMGLSEMLHYTNGSWSAVGYPNNASIMFGVTMLSPTEGWAVGSPPTYTMGHGNSAIILHYLNGVWSQVPVPTSANDLNSVAMVSSSEGWAAGYDTLLHYQNGEWSQVASPTRQQQINGVAAVAPNDVWAVGADVILHYDGGSWGISSVPAGDYLTGVALTSATDGWAVGNGVILHFDGTQWTA